MELKEHEGLSFTEVIKQEYNPGAISGGLVEGHPVDSLYVKFHANESADETTILLRPDEVAALAWVCSGVLYSYEMQKLINEE